MKKSAIRETLNRLLWDPKYRHSREHVIEYKHRENSREVIKKIYIKDIISIGGWYIIVKCGEREKVIPFHRITRIISQEGRVLWAKA